MDVGKLFNLPQVSSSAVNKRKWNDNAAVPAPSATEPASKAARVEDDPDDQGLVAANGDGEVHFDDDDEDQDRRFFSGGLTDEQAKILDIMDRDPAEASGSIATSSASPGVLDVAGLRKQMLRFERTITRNAEMRVKYADDPARFIESEADLDTELKALVVLTTNPTLFYPEFVKLSGASSLVALLTHDNADISAAAIEVLEELTDEDVGQNDEDDEEQTQGPQQALATLIDAILEHSVADLLVSNLGRFQDQSLDVDAPPSKRQEMENDAQAIYHTISVLTNLVSLRPALIPNLCASTELLSWILSRIASKAATIDQNTAYAAELLAILAHLSASSRSSIAQTRIETGTTQQENGMDVLLGVIARFRKRGGSGQQQTTEQVELLENALDVVCALVSAGDVDADAEAVRNSNKRIFLDAEGIELMVLLMSAKTCNVPRLRLDALRVLGHAMSGPDTHDLCLRFVECQGLAPLFSLLMMDSGGSKKSARMSHTHIEHLLGILVELFTHLPSDSEPRFRLLAKFVTASYQKVDRLVQIRAAISERIDKAARTAVQEDQNTEDVYLSKLDVGLFSLQLLDTILAWLVMEDDAVRDHLAMLLARHSLSFKTIVATLQEYHDNIGDQMSVVHETGGGDQLRTKDILEALIRYLDAL